MLCRRIEASDCQYPVVPDFAFCSACCLHNIFLPISVWHLLCPLSLSLPTPLLQLYISVVCACLLSALLKARFRFINEFEFWNSLKRWHCVHAHTHVQTNLRILNCISINSRFCLYSTHTHTHGEEPQPCGPDRTQLVQHPHHVSLNFISLNKTSKLPASSGSILGLTHFPLANCVREREREEERERERQVSAASCHTIFQYLSMERSYDLCLWVIAVNTHTHTHTASEIYKTNTLVRYPSYPISCVSAHKIQAELEFWFGHAGYAQYAIFIAYFTALACLFNSLLLLFLTQIELYF